MQNFLDWRGGKQFNLKAGESEIVDLVDIGKLEELTGFKILPSSNPIEGLYGFLFWKEQIRGQGLPLQVKIFSRAESLEYENYQDLNAAFQKAFEADRFLIKYDDPMRLVLGFIEVKNSGSFWHHISLVRLRETT